MKTLDQLRSDGYILCLPQRTKLDTGIINKLQCRLKCPLESKIILHVVSAYDYLVRKHSASCVFFSPLFLPTFVASL